LVIEIGLSEDRPISFIPYGISYLCPDSKPNVSLMKKIILLLACVFASVFLMAQTMLHANTKDLPDGIHRLNVNSHEATGLVINSLQEGVWVTYFPSDQLHLLQQFVNGKLNGLSIEMNENGFIELQATYFDDYLQGKLLRFKVGGKITLEENYHKGVLNGLRKVYYERGQLKEESAFVDGIRNGTTIWYSETGKRIAVYNYANGLFDGVQQTYFTDGSVKTEQSFVANQLHGDSFEYFNNGSIRVEGKFENGKKDGNWKTYNENGELIQSQLFEAGEEIK
jgi:antitoxin component YwqK of YwqJK toxin-antitoxin module